MRNYPNLRKEPQSWCLFVLSLLRTHARGRAGRRSSCSFERSLLRRQALSFVRKGLGSLLSYPLLVATLCFNPAKGPQTASRSAEYRGRATGIPCTLALDLRIVDRRRSSDRERRLHFDSPTRTRVNSDSCVNDGYCLRHFSVDTAPSTYFSPFPSRTLPRSTRTMTDSGQLRSSISLPGYHVDFFYFRGARQLWTLYRQPLGCDLFWKRRKHQQTDIQNSKVSLHSIVDQAGPHHPSCSCACRSTCVRALRGQCAIWRWRCDFP